MSAKLVVESASAQAQVDDRPFQELHTPDGRLLAQFYRQQTAFLLRFLGIADYQVPVHGNTVVCRPVLGGTDAASKQVFAAHVLPRVESRLGKAVVHASAVVVGPGCVAFLGASGRGKSTLAASFAANGRACLADDVVILEEDAGKFLAHPSAPSIRLWKDSDEALSRLCLGPPSSNPDRSSGPAPRSGVLKFSSEPHPVHRMYFLGDGSSPAVKCVPASRRSAFVELVKHSFLLEDGEHDLIAGHFSQLSRLVRLPIFYHLDFPRRFDALPEVHAAILKHCDT